MYVHKKFDSFSRLTACYYVARTQARELNSAWRKFHRALRESLFTRLISKRINFWLPLSLKKRAEKK